MQGRETRAAGMAGDGVRWADRPLAVLCANALGAAAYLALGVLTDLFFRQYGFFPAPLWPAASLSVAGALLMGWKAVPGLFLGALAANHVVFQATWVEAAGLAAGNAVGPVLGVALARRLGGPLTPLPGLRAVASFALGAVGAHAAVTAVGGVAVLVVAGTVPGDLAVPVAVRWWLSDAGGALVLAPAVLLWTLDRGVGAARGRLAELLLVSAVTLAGAAALFTGVRFHDPANAALPFLLLVPLAWMAMRFLLRDAYTLFSVLVLLMVGGTVMGYGPFAAPGIETPMLYVGVFIVTAALTVLSCGAQANDRRRAERGLRRMVDTLEQTVAERTAALKEGEAQLRLVLEDAPVPLFVTSLRTHRLLFVNSRAERLLESPRDRLIGVYAPAYWADPAARERLLESVARDGHARDREAQFRRGDTELVALLSAARTVFDGEPAMVLGFNDITERKRLEAELKRLAVIDDLTELPNRRHFLERLEAEAERARRYGRPLSVAMVDLDNFKAINDSHGHAAGDAALCRFAALGRDALRASDVIGRMGGEEFAIALPETALGDAVPVMERLRAMVAAQWVHEEGGHGEGGHGDGCAFGFTVSVGIAELRGDDDVSRLLSRADRALYAAKRQGRNRVVPEGPADAEGARRPEASPAV